MNPFEKYVFTPVFIDVNSNTPEELFITNELMKQLMNLFESSEKQIPGRDPKMVYFSTPDNCA